MHIIPHILCFVSCYDQIYMLSHVTISLSSLPSWHAIPVSFRCVSTLIRLFETHNFNFFSAVRERGERVRSLFVISS